MALTQTDWVAQKTKLPNVNVSKCRVTFTTAENDAYTKATPSSLDPTKPWTLAILCNATPDGQAVPVDLWMGFSDSFALAGNDTTVAPAVAGTGAKIKQILDDAVLAVTPLVYVISFDPSSAVADVVTAAAIATGLKVKIPIAPNYVINLNGGSTLNATYCDFIIIQQY